MLVLIVSLFLSWVSTNGIILLSVWMPELGVLGTGTFCGLGVSFGLVRLLVCGLREVLVLQDSILKSQSWSGIDLGLVRLKTSQSAGRMRSGCFCEIG